MTQSQKTQGFCVVDFATLSNERKSRSKIVLLFNTDNYCLTACLHAKCCNPIGWILELGPSIHFRIDGRTVYTLSIKVKTQDFWEDGRETIDRGREMLVTFGKLSVNFQKLSGKT